MTVELETIGSLPSWYCKAVASEDIRLTRGVGAEARLVTIVHGAYVAFWVKITRAEGGQYEGVTVATHGAISAGTRLPFTADNIVDFA